MSNIRKTIICILSISLVIFAITTNVFATADDLFSALTNNSANKEISNIEERNTSNSESNNTSKNNIISGNTNTNKNTSANTNKNTNINKNADTANADEHADAGVDYSIVFIIAICGISTIYAYKKIRAYNI